MKICKGKSGHLKNCVFVDADGVCDKDEYYRCQEAIREGRPLVVSYSSIETYIRCPRKFELNQLMGIKSVDLSDPLLIGKAVDDFITNDGVNASPITEVWQVKSNAICDAHKMLIKPDGFNGQQYGEVMFGNDKMIGYTDSISDDKHHGKEYKTTSRPDYYTEQFNVEEQLSAYFLMFPYMIDMILSVIRVPTLRQTGIESLKEFNSRCYKDIMSRPEFYFDGYDGDGSFGIKIFRGAVNLKRYKAKIEWVIHQIKETIINGEFYEVRSACTTPFKCDYLYLCKNHLSGMVLPDSYQYRGEVKRK